MASNTIGRPRTRLMNENAVREIWWEKLRQEGNVKAIESSKRKLEKLQTRRKHMSDSESVPSDPDDPEWNGTSSEDDDHYNVQKTHGSKTKYWECVPSKNKKLGTPNQSLHVIIDDDSEEEQEGRNIDCDEYVWKKQPRRARDKGVKKEVRASNFSDYVYESDGEYETDSSERSIEEGGINDSQEKERSSSSRVGSRNGKKKLEDDDSSFVECDDFDDEMKERKPSKRWPKKSGSKMEAAKILLDSMVENCSIEETEAAVLGENDRPKSEFILPLKFTFGIEPQPEKSVLDLEMERLWEECELAKRAGEMDVEKPMSEAGVGDVFPQENEINRATLCACGKHDLYLDEEIGYMCKNCSYVLEIRHVLPSFGKNPFGRTYVRGIATYEQSLLDRLQNIGSDSNIGLDFRSSVEGTVWDLIPGTKNELFPHQIEGFEFIWNSIAGGIQLEKLKDPSCSETGRGCIISHAPGTGKTRLTIMFLLSYLNLFPNSKPLIIAPCSMLLTWAQEFKKWKVKIPFHILNNNDVSDETNRTALSLLARSGCYSQGKIIRMVKLYSWKNDKSILGIGYTLFEKLVGVRKSLGSDTKQRSDKNEKLRKILLETPDLIVFDEGHTARNAESLIFQALSNIKTEKRILLSGTPFQNNFNELFNTLCLVRPMFAEKFESGEWASLTSAISKATDDEDHKLRQLRALIDPFVHIHKGTVLQEALPGLKNFLVILKPTELQQVLLRSIQKKRPSLEMEYIESLISVHPSLMLLKSGKKEHVVNVDQLEKHKLNPDAGVKTKFLMKLIRLSEAINDKVLIFSQYIEPLYLLRDQLKSQLNWSLDNEVLFMDGKVAQKQRQLLMDIFNETSSKARVLLASIKACGEGINLVGASRVVLLDVVWNPSVEWQAICRAYRLGQKKVVHVYHLFTSGTKEENKFSRQGEKDRLSKLVFSSSECNERPKKLQSAASLGDRILEEMTGHQNLKDMFEKISYQQREYNSIETFSLLL